MNFDWLIVGAGFTGAVVAERLANAKGKKVLVIDQRPHIAGNAYDCRNASGQFYHKYGPHIFHTNSARVFSYLSGFTSWRPYEHRVMAEVAGQLVSMPVNLKTIEVLFGSRQSRIIAGALTDEFGLGARIPILQLRSHGDSIVRGAADVIYDSLFLGYTRKHWGLDPDQLLPHVTARVPIVVSHDDRYFPDTYQCMPRDGYAALFTAMLASSNIHLALDTDYESLPKSIRYDRVLYTGTIDGYYRYAYGQLPYRSVRFVHETRRPAKQQPVAQINYPDARAYTRTTEMSHLTGEDGDADAMSFEYPEPHAIGRNEPYYPVPTSENRRIYSMYRERAESEAGRIVFAGRLGSYQYLNMDQAVGAALKLAETL